MHRDEAGSAPIDPSPGAGTGWRTRLRAWVDRHLFLYLAALVGLALLFSVVFAREDLGAALARLDARWVGPVLLLSLLNYLLRFAKWQFLLGRAGTSVPWGSSARIFFSCFTMVVTPARLGELYKLLFLRRLHSISFARGLPVLLVERLGDGVAVLALGSLALPPPWGPLAAVGVLGGSMVAGGLLGRPGAVPRLGRVLGRLPGLRDRSPRVLEFLEHNRRLLVPASLGPSLILSLGAWWSECVGLWALHRGLGAPLDLLDATWVYALATAVGNLSFLPGGLGSTELSLFGFLRSLDIGQAAATASTLLVRAATLWFAVAIGVAVALLSRRQLRWDEIRREGAGRGHS